MHPANRVAPFSVVGFLNQRSLFEVEMPEHFSRLTLYCPIERAENPARLAINESTMAWAAKQGIPSDRERRERFSTMRPGVLAAGVVPHGKEEGLAAFADYHTWLFAFDDDYCDEAENADMDVTEWAAFLARLHRVAETGDIGLLPDNAYAWALRDVASRISACATPTQFCDWADAVRSYFAALVWERSRRRNGEKPQRLDDYLLLRLRNGAMQSSIALLDVANGYVLPQELRDTPEVRALVEMCAVLVSLDNDIFSHHKESQRGSLEVNLLDVLASERQTTTAESLHEAVVLRNTVMRRFVELSERTVTPEVGAELRRFVESLGRWVRANLDFSLVTTRYAGPVRERLVLSPHAPDPRPTEEASALDSAVIGWWWRTPDAAPAGERRRPSRRADPPTW
ncbi:terpene synthase [Kitasatospora sp. NPDC088160]|uniref:terpene synthase family protein n=1 Tax=Kitasatospora sp. NPDC088160 TaxID=3364072 RepID=UPI0038177514